MKREREKTTIFLSLDLLTEIFLRLPVKSLFRFKSVSKLWRSLISHLISDPKFARLHFELTASHSQKLALLSSDASEIQLIDFNASLHDASASSIIKLNFSFLPLQPHHPLRMLGSCRGFIVLDYYPNLYLCNPTSGFHKQLPSPPVNSDPNSEDEPFLFGFGYDSATDDYLVTVVLYNGFENNRVELFSLKSNVWKVWEGPPLNYMPYDHGGYRVGLFFNGALHWIAHHRDREVDVIVVFDLIENSFSEIALPVNFEYCDIEFCELLVFDGFLSISAVGYLCFDGVIWVMEEYNVESSWTMLPAVVSPYIFPKCRNGSGNIVGIDGCGMRLVKFNFDGEVQEERPFPREYISMMHTETLLSLPSE